ncbi:helix-turn-helix domain-containing protein [Nocardia beijingensis]|uniref:TetR/AcrR family transcriptional regulator n=1 Tax=Nocardia beijingensis TaxID=95162 RepID=UPI00344D6941
MGDRQGSTKRPLRADARRNRDQVLAIARETLAAEGFSFSLDKIARRAGVGVGTVYRRFPTRAVLFESVLFGWVEVNEVAHNKALCEALDGTSAELAIPEHWHESFDQMFEAVVTQAKTVGTVRKGRDVVDALDLLRGAAAAVRRARTRAPSAGDRLIRVVLDGLHAARAQPR